jgi:hypothetical protein
MEKSHTVGRVLYSPDISITFFGIIFPMFDEKIAAVRSKPSIKKRTRPSIQLEILQNLPASPGNFCQICRCTCDLVC